MVLAAARCFDQASFEVMGQRAELPPRGSAVIPPLGSCGRALLAAIIANRHWYWRMVAPTVVVLRQNEAAIYLAGRVAAKKSLSQIGGA